MEYKVGDRVKYRCPMKIHANGEIEIIYKVIDAKQEYYKDKIMYVIKFDLTCYPDHVVEEDIIGSW